MIKHNILTLTIAGILMISCEKDLPITETKSPFILDSWEISKSATNFQINPIDLFFVNAEVGFVVGYNGDIYKTTDSGNVWQKQNSGTTLHLYSVFFLNENIGFAAGKAMSGCLSEDCGKGSVLLKTTNGGETWTKTFLGGYTGLYSLIFFGELNGLAIIHTTDVPNERNEFMARTTDGGLSWELADLAIDPSYNDLLNVDDVIFVAGENRKILKSMNHGIDWEVINTPVEAWNDVQNIYFINKDIGFINGTTTFYKTTDSGQTWEAVDFPFTSFGIFHFYNADEGFNIKTVAAYEGGDFPTIKEALAIRLTTLDSAGKNQI